MTFDAHVFGTEDGMDGDGIFRCDPSVRGTGTARNLRGPSRRAEAEGAAGGRARDAHHAHTCTSLGSSRARAWRDAPNGLVVATVLASTRSFAVPTKDIRGLPQGCYHGAPDVLALLVGELVHVLD